MKILFLQSPYSLFFNELGKYLLKKKNRVYSLAFTLGDVFLKKDLKNIKVWKELKKKPLEQDYKNLIDDIEKIDNLYFKLRDKVDQGKLTQKEKIFFYKYYKFLEAFILENKIEKIVMMNDLRWQHAIAIHLAKKYNIDYIVFELGLFRPNTITLDHRGVNFNNSVPQNKNFYFNLKSFYKYDYTSINSGITEKQRNLILIAYILLNKFGKLLGIYCPENNRGSMLDYFKRFKNTYIKKKAPQNATLERKYIFAPLQVKTDTQTIVHSDYNSMTEFMEDTITGVREYRKKYKSNIELVFKEHPMDQGKVSYDDFYKRYKNYDWVKFLKNGNTKEIIKDSELVITINSTVGLEAIEMYKPVICMGRSFFTIEGIARESHLDRLADDVNLELVTIKDKELIDNFLNYLRYEYSIEGNLYYYNEIQLKNICDIILEVR